MLQIMQMFVLKPATGDSVRIISPPYHTNYMMAINIRSWALIQEYHILMLLFYFKQVKIWHYRIGKTTREQNI